LSFLDTLAVEPLPPALNAGGFDCGELDLTDYLCDGSAENDQKASVSRTYLVRTQAGEIVGYFSVLADAIRLHTKERPDGCNYPSAPALKLGRMGRDVKYRGQDIGRWILDYVVGMARAASVRMGVRYVTLDALKRPKLIAWYKEYGFVENKAHGNFMARIRNLASRDKLDHVSMRFDIVLQ